MITPFRTTSRAAFTLTELMISIALALLLIIGVNVVFQATSDTLSAGQQVAEANRAEQSLHTVLSDDMRSLVRPDEAPFLFIRSERRAAFYNRDEMNADADFDGSEGSVLSYDHDADPGTPEQAPSAAIYNHRNHRIDSIGFFARGRYGRQTGAAANEVVADALSHEAYIWYGHTKKPNYNQPEGDATGFKRYGPAEDTLDNNPENWFVEDWTLGRVVLLLARLEGGNASYRDGGDMTMGFIRRAVPNDDFSSAAPLAVNSLDTAANPATSWRLHWSRYDAVGTTFQEYRRILGNWIENQGPSPQNAPWFDAITPNRFHYSPVIERPLEPHTIARAVPGLMDGTSQFIVEFAGDFVTQNNDPTSPDFGQVIGMGPDGVLDFYTHWDDANDNGDIDSGEQNSVRAVIRWYGMPRDLNGDGVILAGGPAVPTRHMVDVVPVSDVIATSSPQVPLPPAGFVWFERYLPTTSSGNYAATGTGGMPLNNGYLAAWGPDTLHLPKPQYIRFVVGTVPTSANSSDRIAEYVFKLK